MGLKSADYGVKSDLQKRVPSAFRTHETLAEMRIACGLQRAEAVATLDGNVLLRAVPTAVQSAEGYVAILVGNVKSALEAARTVVVVFDEPEHMSVAKREEQARRDAACQKAKIVASLDFAAPKDDAYAVADIRACADVHVLMDERASRARFMDYVCMQAKKQIDMLLGRWKARGHDAGAVIFDGVDPRGAERPVGAPRLPAGVVCEGGTVPMACKLLDRASPVGEGDLKIMHIERNLAALCSGGEEGAEHGFKCVKVYIACTIDTDSFAIEMLEEARRRDTGSDLENAAFSTVLCMRERPKKTKSDAPFNGQAYYLCADVAMLTSWLAQTIAPLHPSLTRNAVAFAVAGWAVAGCDFVALKGARANVNLDAAARIVRGDAGALALMQAAWSGNRDATLSLQKPVHALLREAAFLLEQTPRLKKAAAAVACPPADVLRRTAWTVAYWCGHEFCSGLDVDFGFSAPCPACSEDLF